MYGRIAYAYNGYQCVIAGVRDTPTPLLSTAQALDMALPYP